MEVLFLKNEKGHPGISEMAQSVRLMTIRTYSILNFDDYFAKNKNPPLPKYGGGGFLFLF